MFVDASALTAMLADEEDAPQLLGRLQRTSDRITSPLAMWETAVAIERLLGLSGQQAQEALEQYCALLNMRIEPVPPQAFSLAMEAWSRFGKGRHKAALNFGDCFAYACARHFGLPLLYKGRDFALTDIEPA